MSVGSYPPALEAAMLVGVVLLEAIVLYLAYGLAERALGGALIDRIERG